MALEEMVRGVVEVVRDHQVWAAPIVGVLAFCESLAFVSILIPAWSALIGIGALVGASDVKFWQVWVAAAIGASLGDWLSYWLGYTFKERVARIWPLSRYPEMLHGAEKFHRAVLRASERRRATGSRYLCDAVVALSVCDRHICLRLVGDPAVFR